MFNACSTTARRGALDWAKVFEETNLPVFERLYESVKNGSETRRSLEFNGRSTYREDLAKELKEIDEQEIWRAGTCLATHALPTHARLTNSQARSCARSAPTTSLRRGVGGVSLVPTSPLRLVYPKALARCILASMVLRVSMIDHRSMMWERLRRLLASLCVVCSKRVRSPHGQAS